MHVVRVITYDLYYNQDCFIITSTEEVTRRRVDSVLTLLAPDGRLVRDSW